MRLGHLGCEAQMTEYLADDSRVIAMVAISCGDFHVEVRWAETDRPAAAEEELHRRHRERFGRLPRYTFFT